MTTDGEKPAEKQTYLQKKSRVFRPAFRLSIAALAGLGLIAGVLFLAGFNWTLEATNTEAFCVSCHEMRDNPYKNLKETIHWSNRTGVRATCPDCHVPKNWFFKIRRKIEASNELYHHFILGTVDTPEKFEAEKLTLATRVWATMKSTDSRECRNCHHMDSMDFEKQSRPAQKRHRAAIEKGLTCIDCHKGIAHHLPKGYEESSDTD
ncbi:MAG: NapC/NirT family cytochrome c [Rhodomicrobium sp.]|jgi:cytochrome c-type protein NapC